VVKSQPILNTYTHSLLLNTSEKNIFAKTSVGL